MKILLLTSKLNTNSPRYLRVSNLYIPLLNRKKGFNIKLIPLFNDTIFKYLKGKAIKQVKYFEKKYSLLLLFSHLRTIKPHAKNADFAIAVTSRYALFYYITLCLIKCFNHKCITILDLGDPYSFNPENSRIKKFLSKIAERYFIKKVDVLFVTTEKTKELYKRKFCVKNKIYVLMQGANKVILEKVLNECSNLYEDIFKNNSINLIYTGRFYDKIRSPMNFYKALSNLEEPIRNSFNVLFAGKIEKRFLPDNPNFPFLYIGNVDNKISLAIQKKADMLLMFGNNSLYQTPGKIFEYIATKNKLLCIMYYQDKFIFDLLKKNNLGYYCYNNIEDIKNHLLNVYKIYVKDNYKLKKNENVIPIIYWENRIEQLEKVLYRIKKIKNFEK